MKMRLGILILGLVVSAQSVAQVREFDKLEMYFAQRHYKQVYRYANRLMDKPEFDYSLVPKYYKSISIFQLSQNSYWLSKHQNELDEAEKMFLKVKYDPDGEKLFNAHMYEIAWLRDDMRTWLSDLKRSGSKDADRIQKLMYKIFEGVPDIDIPGESDDTEDHITLEIPEIKTERDAIIARAKEQLGVPYVWAGNSPDGFDCSGFTAFVLEQSGVSLPRRSVDQFDGARKLDKKEVQKGDLVFFNNGSGVSHVGIVISEKGKPIVMIHSSSSKGIIITEVEKSEYWLNRLHGYGTYLH